MGNLRLVPATGPVIEVAKDEALVGRDPSCEVVVADGSISRRHARLKRRGESWIVVDQGSANGTFVDSHRVAEITLQNGQELRFGAVSFKVELASDDDGATMASLPVMSDATVMSSAPLAPPSAPQTTASLPMIPAISPPPPLPPPVPPAAKPPAPPSAAQAKERFRPPTPPGAAAAAPVPQMAAGPAPAKKGKGPVFWVFAGCCGCLLLVVVIGALMSGGLYFMTQAPATAVREQLKALKAHDANQACAVLAASGSLDCDRLLALASQHPGLGDNKDATFWKRSVENDHATFSGLLTSEGGKGEAVTYTLAKEGADWKVMDIRFDGMSVD